MSVTPAARGPVAAGILAVLATVVPAAPPAAGDATKTKGWSAAAKAELGRLAGSWEVIQALDADKASEPANTGLVLTFKGTVATMTFGGKAESVRVGAIDPGTDPKCIDLIETRRDKTERVLEGVYRVDGDKLQLAFSIPKDGKSRPTGFERPAAGSRAVVWVMKRVNE